MPTGPQFFHTQKCKLSTELFYLMIHCVAGLSEVIHNRVLSLLHTTTNYKIN